MSEALILNNKLFKAFPEPFLTGQQTLGKNSLERKN